MVNLLMSQQILLSPFHNRGGAGSSCGLLVHTHRSIPIYKLKLSLYSTFQRDRTIAALIVLTDSNGSDQNR